MNIKGIFPIEVCLEILEANSSKEYVLKTTRSGNEFLTLKRNMFPSSQKDTNCVITRAKVFEGLANIFVP